MALPTIATRSPRSALGLGITAEVRAELARQRRTMSWLAPKLGRSVPYVSRVLADQNGFTVDEAVQCAEALGLRFETLVDRARAAGTIGNSVQVAS